MSHKVLGKITVQFDDGERTFNVRRRRSTEQARLLALLGIAAGKKGLTPTEDGQMSMSMDSFDPEKYAEFHIESCRTGLGNEDGTHAFSADEIDEWGSENIAATIKALDVFYGPKKTSVDHSGN